MTNELGPLFNQPRARQTDPQTSREAARIAAPRAEGDRAKCLEIVRSKPGCTSAEIAQFASMDRHAAARRLPELESAGLVEKGEARICRANKTRAVTWILARKHQIGGVA